jgi:hypothetical protein
MPKILKGAPIPHAVVVDTNILWAEDKAPPVTPEFDEFWKLHVEIVELDLVVPTVVRGELLYQQTTAALKALAKVEEHLGRISAITAVTHPHKLSSSRLEAQIAAKIDKWLRQKKARLVEVPYTTVDWPAVVETAVWRRPPFTADAKNPEAEKGFRDALILESVAAFVAGETRTVRVAFACADKVLREAAGTRIVDPRFACYESLSSLSSFLKLTHERLTDTFIKGILRRATKKFFTADDPACLYVKEKIGEKIHESSKALVANPTSASGTPFVSLLTTSWNLAGGGRSWISAAQFDRLVGDREYHWISSAMSVWEYQAVPAFGLSAVSKYPAGPPERQVLFITHNAA